MPFILTATSPTSGDATFTPDSNLFDSATLLTGVTGTGTLPLTLLDGLTWDEVIATYDWLEWSGKLTLGGGITPVMMSGRIPTSFIEVGGALSATAVRSDNSDFVVVYIQFAPLAGVLNSGECYVTAGNGTLTAGQLVAYTGAGAS